MAESMRLVDLVQDDINHFLDERAPQLREVSRDLAPLIEFSRTLLSGGKRFRALFCYWGWQSTLTQSSGFDLTPEIPKVEHAAIVRAGAALELFHAAALVHDDIIDSSDTRRGSESIHKKFERLHVASGWSGPSDAFGKSAAILLGDLLLSWSDEAFNEALALTDSPSSRTAARAEHHQMRNEVMLGQYLDILNEQAWMSFPESKQLSRAHQVIAYKSAKYTVEAPLTIGAALGGGTPENLAALRAFGLPLGIAYQLRDDLLGVFGDASVTGKPAGDDLREGKRTVLVALARTALPSNATTLLDELLGDRELTELQVRSMQDTIRASGAVDEVERIIQRNVDVAKASLQGSVMTSSARKQLLELADSAVKRTA